LVAAAVGASGAAGSARTTGCGSYSSSNMTAADLEGFWCTELSPVSQTPQPLLGTPVSVAQATPDECFAGIGNPYPPIVGGTCPSGSIPKTNLTYTWGLTSTGGDVWIGTGPNIGSCLSGTSPRNS